jgi:hypothetical protein
MATGGGEFAPDFEWCSDVMAIFEFEAPAGKVRALCEVLTTGAVPGYFEEVLGAEGSIKMSQTPEEIRAFRDFRAPDWQKWVDLNYLKAEPPPPQPSPRMRPVPETYGIPVALGERPWLSPHLENFFDAIRGGASLRCPADQAFRATAATFKVHEAIAARRTVDLDPAEFEA